jgi:hypothetical protein
MPEGQYSGQRSSYLYTTDFGDVYILSKDVTLANLEGAGLTPATQANAGNANPTPKRFFPRGVYWQGVLDGRIVRKFIVCGSTTADLYQAGISQDLTIDGVVGSTTGRRGEQQTYVRLDIGAAPAQ